MDSTAPKNLQYRPFGIVLRDLLLDANVTTRLGNPAWPAFAATLPGVSYETLRKAVAGERPPSRKVMEVTAKAFGLSPDIFVEHRLTQAQLRLDPTEAGWENAVVELRRVEEHRAGSDQPERNG